MADCACASPNFTSFTDVPSFVHVHPKYTYAGRGPWFDAVDEDFAFVGDDLYSISCSCFLQSSCELLGVLRRLK